MRYKYNQKMKVLRGFYKGYKGRITKYREESVKGTDYYAIFYTLLLTVDGNEVEKEFSETELKPTMW